MRNVRFGIAAAIALLSSGCGGGATRDCLPKGEKGVVLRTGDDEGVRFVTIRRTNGEEVTCTGRTTTVILQAGDEIDGQTLTRASATERP